VLDKLDKFSLLEGDSVTTECGISIKLLSIKNDHSCRVGIRYRGGMKLITADKWYSTPITQDKRIHLKTLDGFSGALLVLMGNHKGLKISKDVHHSTKVLGVLDLEEILDNSIPYSIGRYTHIYRDWLLTIQKKEVKAIHLIGCFYCMDTSKIEVHNECSNCLGRGCEKCSQSGFHKSKIPCQVCKDQKTKLVKERKHYEKNHNKHRR